MKGSARSGLKPGLFALLFALAGAPEPVLACSIALLPPGYDPPTAEQMEAQRLADDQQTQHDLWLKADHVFLARARDSYSRELDAWELAFRADEARRDSSHHPAAGRTPLPPRILPPPPPPMIHMLGEGKTVVILEPVVALKGVAPTRRFDIRDAEGWTSCGPRRQFDVFTPEREDGLFVVFVSGAYPTQDGVLEAMAVEHIVDPDLKAAVQAASAGR